MRHAFFAVGLFVCPPLVAQQAVPASLSLSDAISIAREHNPAYRQTLNNRTAAAWNERGAYTSLVLPSVTASGGVSYTGPGQQRFLTNTFSQSVSTVSSNYSLSLNYELSSATLSAPGLRRAQANAVDADIVGAGQALVANVTTQYLNVLQAIDNARVAQRQLARNDDALKLAQARYAVGRASLIDVRQAQVARGQTEVALLRARTATSIEKLRLFEQLGVTPPTTIEAIVLSDTFAVQQPIWKLEDLLTMAAEQNPSLKALRARETAAAWGTRSAVASYGPSLNASAGWSGFTQQFTNVNPIILSSQAQYGSLYQSCQDDNRIRTNAGLSPNDCSVYVWGSANEQQLRAQNSVFPFNFTSQPFQARLTITLPLFANFQRPAQVAEAKATQQDAEESVRARGLGVQTEVSQAYLNLMAAFQTIAIQDTNRTAAQEQLQLATDRYTIGSGSFLELQDAQVASLRAASDYVGAVYDYHRALAALEAAVGRSLR
jgi:outer membrane protein